MSRLADAKVTVAEAAFVTKAPARLIDREIDAKIIPSSGPKGSRAIKGDALIYIKAVAALRKDLTPALRKRMYSAVVTAAAKGQPVAGFDRLQVAIKEIEDEILVEYAELEDLKKRMIESRAAVLGGEPVLKGTRVPVRIVASLVKKGVSTKEIRDELSLTTEQIDAAVAYDQIAPRRGRPPIKRRNVVAHVSADR